MFFSSKGNRSIHDNGLPAVVGFCVYIVRSNAFVDPITKMEDTNNDSPVQLIHSYYSLRKHAFSMANPEVIFSG